MAPSKRKVPPLPPQTPLFLGPVRTEAKAWIRKMPSLTWPWDTFRPVTGCCQHPMMAIRGERLAVTAPEGGQDRRERRVTVTPIAPCHQLALSQTQGRRGRIGGPQTPGQAEWQPTNAHLQLTFAPASEMLQPTVYPPTYGGTSEPPTSRLHFTWKTQTQKARHFLSTESWSVWHNLNV